MIGGANQLRRHPDAIAGLPDAPLEDEVDAQLAADRDAAGPLPPSDQILGDLERFLREQRDEGRRES